MAENKFQLDFHTYGVRDWEKIAQLELGNKNPWQNLTKKKAGLAVKPYYDASDLLQEERIESARGFRSSDSWFNSPKVFVANEMDANGAALNLLNTGADAIYFVVTGSVKPEVLLNHIELAHCAVYFEADKDPSLPKAIRQYVNSNSARKEICGGLFWHQFPFNDLKGLDIKAWNPRFKIAGIKVRHHEDVVDEIVDALCKAVDIIDRLTTSYGFTTLDAMQAISFSMSVGNDFFIDIAKIRALKRVWLTLQDAYQVKGPIHAWVHAYSPPWVNEDFQPQGNMLKQTYAAMAAAIGGCDALTLEPEVDENSMMRRTALNISSLMVEESHFAKVYDAMAGSYYVEAVTHQIAAEGWKKFQVHETGF